MKKITASMIAAGLLSMPMAGTAQAETLVGNIGITSNYIWRGVTQSSDDSAVSAGIDYTGDANWYVGAWTSSLGGSNNYELDIYGGYRGKVGGFDYDVGVIQYQYPVATNSDFMEIYGSMDFDMFTATVAYTIDKDGTSQDSDLYASIATEIEFRKKLRMGLLFGMYEYDAPSSSTTEDYKHFQVSLSKDNFTFALDKNDKDLPGTADEMRISGSWSMEIDL